MKQRPLLRGSRAFEGGLFVPRGKTKPIYRYSLQGNRTKSLFFTTPLHRKEGEIRGECRGCQMPTDHKRAVISGAKREGKKKETGLSRSDRARDEKLKDV